LRPSASLQADLVARIVVAARRACLEGAGLFRQSAQSALGLALAGERGVRTLDTLVRYRGSALAELFRSLAALKALQAERSMPALPDAKAQQTREIIAKQ
jgi:hypothetical protein